MTKSMTGFGRAGELVGNLNITAEIKSVNARYLEFYPKITKAYSFIEEKLRSYVQETISRGKVEMTVIIDSLDEADVIVEINQSLAAGYYNAVTALAEKFGLNAGDSVSMLTSHSDIFTVRKAPADEEAVWAAVKTVVEKAVANFIAMRETEGAKLKEDILSRGAKIIEHVCFVEERSPQTVREYNEKMLSRMRELLQDAKVDEQRLLTEAAIFADKVAVDEETVRLRSHIAQLGEIFKSEEPVGRKLDFLVQEINREANTIGSKAQDVEIAKRVIEIKAEVEKIREQIQNIE
ncbi:MAG: YicC family protein [Clostridia bacterium]|nr:YicC family protein [Clostridia bacterium]MBR2413654.1 YicC family protein [Clostridia bacterium]MBR3955167.1 YicC family protein [Clostridia bacterium]